jgi:hypothetical protein
MTKSRELEAEVAKILVMENCAINRDPPLPLQFGTPHFIAKCGDREMAFKFKGWKPFTTDISDMKNYADDYHREFNREIESVLVFLGKHADSDVEDFANRLDVKLYPVKKIKRLERDFTYNLGI